MNPYAHWAWRDQLLDDVFWTVHSDGLARGPLLSGAPLPTSPLTLPMSPSTRAFLNTELSFGGAEGEGRKLHNMPMSPSGSLSLAAMKQTMSYVLTRPKTLERVVSLKEALSDTNLLNSLTVRAPTLPFALAPLARESKKQKAGEKRKEKLTI
eukprot:1174185-Prorocentrum_minimum.AAC.2